MYVTRSYHKRIVFALSGVILLFVAFIAVFLFNPSVLGKINNKNAPEYLGTAVGPFLHSEEAFIVASKSESDSDFETKKQDPVIIPVTKVLFEYIEVTGGCGPHFEGECLNMRSGPGEEFPSAGRLRNGVVLKVDGKVERNGRDWYKIAFDEWLRYPERAEGDRYVSADYVQILLDEGDKSLQKDGQAADGQAAATAKKIIVDRSAQTLYAYDGDQLFMEEKISTGLELTPTPRGEFTVFKKTPSRYMQGPIPGIAEEYYDLPGVPWNLYFTHEGAVIHGAYWHTNFGTEHSHGCVNLPPEAARKLYNWTEIGTRVTVKD